jgi:hypothetical protein
MHAHARSSAETDEPAATWGSAAVAVGASAGALLWWAALAGSAFAAAVSGGVTGTALQRAVNGRLYWLDATYLVPALGVAAAAFLGSGLLGPLCPVGVGAGAAWWSSASPEAARAVLVGALPGILVALSGPVWWLTSGVAYGFALSGGTEARPGGGPDVLALIVVASIFLAASGGLVAFSGPGLAIVGMTVAAEISSPGPVDEDLEDSTSMEARP